MNKFIPAQVGPRNPAKHTHVLLFLQKLVFCCTHVSQGDRPITRNYVSE